MLLLRPMITEMMLNFINKLTYCTLMSDLLFTKAHFSWENSVVGVLLVLEVSRKKVLLSFSSKLIL